MPRRLLTTSVAAASGLVAAATLTVLAPGAAAATVTNEAQLRAAFSDVSATSITLSNDISLTDCAAGELFRDTAGVALTLDGGGFTITQTCAGSRVIATRGAGLTLDDVTVTGGDLDGGGGQGLGGGILSDSSGPLVLDHANVVQNSVSGATGGEAGGFFANGPVTLDHATISDNTASGGTSIFSGLAGGFASNGTVTATDTVISGNTAGGSESNGGDAAGVFGNASMTFIRSTISGNVTRPGSTSGSGATAGIAINADLHLVDSTVTGNVSQGAAGTGGGVGAGGAITLVYSTVAGNEAASGSANVAFHGPQGSDVSFGSVIADPLGGAPNCSGTVTTSQGHDYETDGTCGFTNTAAGDVASGADPLLGALAANGGPTQTMLPLPGSPLLDAIASADCQAGAAAGVGVDQRGVVRPQGSGCDIGAVEVEVAPTTTTSAPGATTSTPGTTTSTPGATTTTIAAAPVATPVTASPTFTG